MRYLKARRLVAITYGGEEEGRKNLTIKKYFNSNRAGNYITTKSTFSFIFMLNRGPVSWYAKKQAIIALLSIVIKYISFTLVLKEATQLRLLITKIGLLKASDQYIEIKVIQEKTETDQILVNIRDQKEQAISSIAPHSELEKVFIKKKNYSLRPLSIFHSR